MFQHLSTAAANTIFSYIAYTPCDIDAIYIRWVPSKRDRPFPFLASACFRIFLRGFQFLFLGLWAFFPLRKDKTDRAVGTFTRTISLGHL